MTRAPARRRVAPTIPDKTAECTTPAVANPAINGAKPAALDACAATTLPPTVAVQMISVGEPRAIARPSPTARMPLARRSGDDSSIAPACSASRSPAAANQQSTPLPPSHRIQAAGGQERRAETPRAPAQAQTTSPMQEPRPMRKAGSAPRSIAVRTTVTFTTPSSRLIERASVAPIRKSSIAAV